MPSTPTAQCAVLPVTGSSDIPILAVDLGADELTNALREAAVNTLLVAGLVQVGPDAPPPNRLIPGWCARFAAGQLRITAPDHVVYQGELTVWPALAAAIEAGGSVLTFIGHIALGWGSDAMAAMQAAAARGECAGGIIEAEHIRFDQHEHS